MDKNNCNFSSLHSQTNEDLSFFFLLVMFYFFSLVLIEANPGENSLLMLPA
jgi:hypothetical protein